MKTKLMLVPKTITTAARLTLALGVLMPAVLVVGSDQAHRGILQLGDRVDPEAGFALLAYTVFLASHRLRRVDLINDFMVVRESMDVARKITLREGEMSALVADFRDRVGLWLRSNTEKSRAVLRDLGHMTDARMRLSQ